MLNAVNSKGRRPACRRGRFETHLGHLAVNKKLIYFFVSIIILFNLFPTHYVGISFAQSRRRVKDEIHLIKDNKKVEGEVIHENFEKVKVSLRGGGGGGERVFQLDEIREIHYDQPPSKYSEGKGAMTDGNYPLAIESYQKALEQVKTRKARELFKQHIIFELALCFQRSSQYDSAIQNYDALLKEVPDTRYLREAILNKILCYQMQNKPQQVIKAIEDGKSLASKKIKGDFTLRLDLQKGRILEVSSPSEALTFYEQLALKSVTYPAIADNVAAGKGRYYIRDRQYDQAESIFKEITKRSNDPTALGSAYAGLGDCYLHKAEQDKTLPSYKKALLEGYLKTWVLCYPPEGESIEDYVRSGYWAAYCFEIMSNLFEKEERIQRYREYARNLYEEVKTKFPGTDWEKKSRDRVKRLR